VGRCELPKNILYDDAHVNVLEEALPFQTNHRSRGIKRDRRNSERRSYNFVDLARLVQILSKNYAFYTIRRHVIIKCPHIGNEVRDGFVRHVGQ
jgi:hypothetical protein